MSNALKQLREALFGFRGWPVVLAADVLILVAASAIGAFALGAGVVPVSPAYKAVVYPTPPGYVAKAIVTPQMVDLTILSPAETTAEEDFSVARGIVSQIQQSGVDVKLTLCAEVSVGGYDCAPSFYLVAPKD
jgi:hypothetical protein